MPGKLSIRMHRTGVLSAVLVLVFFVGTETARAEGVPQNLASMAKDLFTQTRAQLKQTTGDPGRDAIRRRARQILDDAGIRYWARGEVRADSALEKPRKHTMTVGDNDDRLDIDWDPETNSFEIRIKANETSAGAGDGFDLRLNGDVLSTPVDGGGAVLSVRPGDPAISVVTAAELRRLREEIFGIWRAGDGDVWEISSAAGGASTEPSSQRPEDRIAELKRRIEGIRSDTVFRWTNPVTEEVVSQDKFRQLKEPFVYDGEVLRLPDGEAEIARVTEKINEIRAANKPLPVVEHDPIGMNEFRAGGKAQSLDIRVTDKNGYSWTYDEAMLLDGRIAMSRTLRSMKDVGNLPQDVVRQAIASWSPPEWVELDVRIDGTTGEVFLSGQLWRLRVTYSGGDYVIKSMHSPWSRKIRLERNAPTLVFLVEGASGFVAAEGTRVQKGDFFIVEVSFDAPPGQAPLVVDLEWDGADGGRLSVALNPFGGSGTVYRSDPLVMDSKGSVTYGVRN